MRLLTVLILCVLVAMAGATLPARAQNPTPPSPAPLATAPGYWPVSGDFECPERSAIPGLNGNIPDAWSGTVPEGWHGALISTTYIPNVESALFTFGGMNCANNSGGIEKIQGSDSWVIQSQDIESTSLPGKPFDVGMYQQVPVTPGTAYTLSGWMVSLCGGSYTPNDCPAGYYISKMLGLDPAGGTDPLAPSVQWVENRTPHIDAYGNKIGWQNLQVAAKASTGTMTVFVRVNSPFQHHGNMAFIDAVRLVGSPRAALAGLPAQINQQSVIKVGWSGDLGPEIPTLSGNFGGAYSLYFDLQYRVGSGGTWQNWCPGMSALSADFYAPYVVADYYFRVRPRAEQPDAAHGFWPHLPGVWSQGGPVHVTPPARPGPYRIFLPQLTSPGGGC